ncbi:electron transport complex subunit E [Chitinispirillales bacterium ANBcel5]|uniref:electron transport complex subunit RsxE n=1 Tax=Cellulosispirillum alkaliphilum TaxID=3039283 RepID=UPI002A50E649|nr:electron transport complex subunit E [Chitinispirillales bacterium ANBcel5]
MFSEEIKRGVVKENPILILALGLCPALAVSTSVQNGFGMGMAATFVLLCSNIIISLIKGWIPAKVRIPCFIVVIATFVSILQLILQAHFPTLNRELGIFIPLIVVNCVILGRAEAFASKNNPFRSVIDGLVMGLGFTFALSILSLFREVLGSNQIWGLLVIPGFEPMAAFVLAPGGFFAIALVMGLITYLRDKKEGTRP